MKSEEEERRRIFKKYKINALGSGVFEEGFFSGIRCAERYYRKKPERKEKK